MQTRNDALAQKRLDLRLAALQSAQWVIEEDSMLPQEAFAKVLAFGRKNGLIRDDSDVRWSPGITMAQTLDYFQLSEAA